MTFLEFYVQHYLNQMFVRKKKGVTDAASGVFWPNYVWKEAGDLYGISNTCKIKQNSNTKTNSNSCHVSTFWNSDRSQNDIFCFLFMVTAKCGSENYACRSHTSLSQWIILRPSNIS